MKVDATRARIVGSSVFVALGVWLALLSDNRVGPLDATSMCIAVLSALGVAVVGTTRRLLRRDTIASAVTVGACCLPWLVSDFVRVSDFWEVGSEFPLHHRFELRFIVALATRSSGAALTVSLLCAEAFTVARLSGPRVTRSVVALSLLLAAPFQLEWRHVSFAPEDLATLNALVWVPIVAALVIPLSLVKGGGRTTQVVAVLALASWAAMAVGQGVTAEHLGGFNPSTPAPRGAVVRAVFEGLFANRWMELAPWTALFALTLALLVTKVSRPMVAVMAVAAVMYVVDGWAIVRMRAAATRAPNVSIAGECLAVIHGNSFDVEAATREAAARGISCVAPYRRDEIDADATSFNAFDHVRALASVESIFRWL